MAGTLHRRLCVLLVAAAAGFTGWKYLPGTALDRAAFTTVSRSFANPPLFVAGGGTHESPWVLRTLAAKTKLDSKNAPLIVSLGDDPEGFFQSSPPSPIDVAVILKNFQRLGAKKAATAAVLAWETPDPIALSALEKALGGFDALVTAAPLSRGSIPAIMPAAFRRASIPLDRIHGDTAAIPAVNRIPLQGIILGGENARAGFTVLETESSAGLTHLVARWEDRAVFAFPLLAVLIRHDLPVDGVEIRLGEYLKLGPGGPVVPIDAYGRLAVPLKSISAFAEIPADRLIDGGDGLFPKSAPEPVILRDDQSAAEPATRAFSKNLSAGFAAIATDAGLAPAHTFRRLPANSEIGILAATVLALVWIAGFQPFKRALFLVILAGLCLAAQWIAAGPSLLWLPGLPVLAATFSAALASISRGTPPPSPAAPLPVPEIPAPKAESPPVKSPKAPAKKTGKKTARKKSPPAANA